MRLFHICVLLHNSPNSTSTGQARPGRYIIHADSASKTPETANTHILCWLNVTKKGIALTIDATVAPIPRVTKVMGIAQQTKVPVVVKRASQVNDVSLVLDVLSVIFNSLVFLYQDLDIRSFVSKYLSHLFCAS